MANPRAVATGFATLDYVVELSEHFSGTGTKRIRHRPQSAWPRAGGAALFTCRQLAKAGFDAAPITWIGADANAQLYRAACREYSINTVGIESHAANTTPTCILIYQPNGDYGCLFDSGGGAPEKLSETQRSLLQTADLVLIAAGPPSLGNEVLSLIRPDAIVAWIAKTDHFAYPEDLRRRYSARADFIFCNSGERFFVDASFKGPKSERQIIVETRGGDGILVDTLNQKLFISVDYVETPDTTGAGDTLAGATLAQFLGGNTDMRSAIDYAIKETASLLKRRC